MTIRTIVFMRQTTTYDRQATSIALLLRGIMRLRTSNNVPFRRDLQRLYVPSGLIAIRATIHVSSATLINGINERHRIPQRKGLHVNAMKRNVKLLVVIEHRFVLLC